MCLCDAGQGGHVDAEECRTEGGTLRDAAGDVLWLQGVGWKQDVMRSSCEVGGDPLEGFSLDLCLVKPVDQGVV